MLYMLLEIAELYAVMFIPFAFYCIVLIKIYADRGIDVTKGFAFGLFALSAVFTAIVYATGAAGLDEVLRFKTSMLNSSEINVIPLVNGEPKGMLLNLLLFVPLGVILPLLWTGCKSIKTTVIIGFLFSLVIEISQLFNFRATDIDDLIMNTLGTAAGFLIYRAALKNVSLFSMEGGGKEAAINLSAMFIIYFFIGMPVLNLLCAMAY
ncbi:MAG: VanZ family protein [Clostridia bacterium]|nr:VanZ family protein [Clostridia bacterium]